MRWRSRRRKRHLGGKIIAGVVGIIILGLGLGYALHANRSTSTSTPAKTANTSTREEPLAYDSVNGRYLFSGTIVLDRVVVSAAGGDYNQPFSKMDTFGKFDAGIADLECPVTDAPNLFMINVDNPHFNCRPDWLPALKKYFQIVKLSGNHTYDKGADGFVSTIKNLQDAGIQAVGNYNPHAEPKHNCEIVALPVRLKKTGGSETAGTLPIAFCAFNYKIIYSTPEPGELALISEYAKTMPVFGFLQAGSEYQTTAAPATSELAHKFIDAGAQFVIANGAHYIQNSEAYQGKPIMFSIGNFIFDQVDAESRRSVSFDVAMSVDYDQNVAKWLELSKTCNISNRADDCLAAAKKQGLRNFDVKLTYKPLAGVGGARAVTHLSSDAEQKAVLDRLDWANTCSQLIGNTCVE